MIRRAFAATIMKTGVVIPYICGIKSAKADLDKKECEVTFSPDKITPDEMCKLLSDIGFPAEVKNA